MGFSGILLAVARYVGCILAPYYLFLLTYRLRYHPLKGYPGPFLAKLSDSYAGYYVLKRSLQLATFEDHQRYGDVMRYGPNRLVFNSITALHDIYQNPRVTKSSIYLFSKTGPTTIIFNALDRDAHLRKRKFIAPALSPRSMGFFEPTMTGQVDLFLKVISSCGSHPVDMTDRCRRLTMDVAVRLSFGFPLTLQTANDYDFILSGIALANYRINSFMNFPALSYIPIEAMFKKSPLRNKWHRTIAKMTTERLSESKDAKHDLYSFIMNNLDAGSEDIRDSELFMESLFFISAGEWGDGSDFCECSEPILTKIQGGDTVSSAMAALFFYLSRYPKCYDALSSEIRTKFAKGSEIQGGPQLASCRYLRACINEALRMSPPIGGTLWRELAHDQTKEPLVIDGHIIPPGTQVGVNTYSIHHNEAYFPDPFTFKPERWLSDSDSPPADGQDDDIATTAMYRAFVPFSVGGRSCVGKAMAYLETSLVMAKTLWYFDFEKAPGELGEVGGGHSSLSGGRGRVDEFQMYDVITSRHEGPYLKFTARSEYCHELGGQ
ncbi:cytochrome P450 [Xylariomycetidae sp. FL2044]|nr:cytochrome P450 [Xylariomycetidae sp. FL2044]